MVVALNINQNKPNYIAIKYPCRNEDMLGLNNIIIDT